MVGHPAINQEYSILKDNAGVSTELHNFIEVMQFSIKKAISCPLGDYADY